MRFELKRVSSILVPVIALSAGLLTAGCQNGGTAISSYNGAQFQDAISTRRHTVRHTQRERGESGTSRKTAKATASLAVPAPVPAKAPPVATDAEVTAAPVVLASLREHKPSSLPGVGDPFAQVSATAVLPSARPKRTPSKRQINGADMPLLKTHSGSKVALRRARYAPIIRKHAKAHGVPVKLAMAVVQIESMYRANAVGSAGEIGLMQILPRTARFIGYKGPMKKLHDPETNISYGMKYLGKAHRLGGGSTCGTILKYNAGHGAKKMNAVSREYCRRIRRILQET